MKNKLLTKIQEDNATEANWPKCTRDFIHGCNQALLRGQSLNLAKMSTSETLVKHFTYECYELDGTFVKRTGKFYYSMFSFRPDTKMSYINVSKNRKQTAFEKPPSLN